MNLTELAQRIKRLRLDRQMNLDEVASRTGLSRSWLSKVENFRITPSLPALAGIAKALGVTLSQLVEGLDARPQIVIVRNDEREVVTRDSEHRSRTIYESLAHKHPSRRMDPFLLTVPAGEARDQALPHEGEEFLMVIEGKTDFEYGGQIHQLAKGDCLYFDATVEHRLINNSDQEAKVLCVFHGMNGL
ncbi:MAG: cupin domain-containing protein [Phycisphaeraceae bacterium]